MKKNTKVIGITLILIVTLSSLLAGCLGEKDVPENDEEKIIGNVSLGDEIDGEVVEVISENEIKVKINKTKGKNFTIGETIQVKYSSVEIVYSVTDEHDSYVLDNEELYEEKEYEKHYPMNVGDKVSFWVTNGSLKENDDICYLDRAITKIVIDSHLITE